MNKNQNQITQISELQAGYLALEKEIQALKLAQETLKETENKFRILVEQAAEGILVLQESQRKYYNSAWLEIIGYSSDEYESTPFLSLVYHEDFESVKDSYQDLAAGSLTEQIPDFRIVTKSGKVKWLSIRSANIEWEGKPAELIFFQDVSERKQAELALAKSGAHLQRSQEVAHVGSWELDLVGGELFWSDETYCIFGLPRETPMDYETFLNCIMPEDRDYVDEKWQAALAGAPYDIEHRIRVRDGVKWVHEKAEIEFDQAGRAIRGIGIVIDITEHKQQELQIQSYQQQLKALAAQLTVNEEQERRRIAVELHDHVGQALAFARIQIAAAQKSQPEAARNALLEETSEILKEAIQKTRNLVFDLSSPLLNELGLSAAISDWLQTHAEGQAGLKTELVEIGPDLPLSADLRAILFRNVRELLTNVIRHADATRVSVILKQTSSEVCVTVQDDGIGFQADEISLKLTRSRGFGLFSIQENVNDLGGSLTINSAPGEGAKIAMCVPYWVL